MTLDLGSHAQQRPTIERLPEQRVRRDGSSDDGRGARAETARDESGGAIEAVGDAQIMDAYRDLARREGLFAEPASAASVAGLRARAKAGRTKGLRRVVCVLTGNGLKDPDAARALAGDLTEVEATADAVRRVLATS